MKPYQARFIELAQRHEALRFGDFTLKSGRESPYFFNAGALASGAALAEVGRAYAQSIVDAGLVFDVLLGPAYKGIPLAAVTAAALHDVHGLDVPFAYNRKEAKDHGEGGVVVGAPLAGRVLVLDDVITAGTAIAEVAALIEAAGARLAGVVIGLDREELGAGSCSAVEEVSRRYGIPVVSIIRFGDILEHAGGGHTPDEKLLTRLRAYRDRYGAGALEPTDAQ